MIKAEITADDNFLSNKLIKEINDFWENEKKNSHDLTHLESFVMVNLARTVVSTIVAISNEDDEPLSLEHKRGALFDAFNIIFKMMFDKAGKSH